MSSVAVQRQTTRIHTSLRSVDPKNQSVTDESVFGIQVETTDPASSTVLPPSSAVPKYEMPVETYSSLPDTVLAYKKSHQIGRFDPHAPESKEKKVAEMWREIDAAGKASLAMRLSSLTGASSNDLRCIMQGSTPRGAYANLTSAALTLSLNSGRPLCCVRSDG